MAIQRTLSMIKPDAVAAGHTGAIIAAMQENGLNPVAMRMMHLSEKEAGGFYAVHRDRPFYGELVEFMSSGPIVAMVLEGEDAIANYRKLMGATNPADAAEGTLRARFAKSIGENAVHGSDASETAAFEIAYFFRGVEL